MNREKNTGEKKRGAANVLGINHKIMTKTKAGEDIDAGSGSASGGRKSVKCIHVRQHPCYHFVLLPCVFYLESEGERERVTR